ncbi:MAG: hypothetical protein H6719_27515 [Sandaracinaceae bacterium]|nr:hypothetical protein [Sandaracinaceae bacterium]
MRLVTARLCVLCVVLLGCDGSAPSDAGPTLDDAGADAGPPLHPERYPVDPRSWTPETCAADQATAWVVAAPGACASGRVCVDGAGRTYRDGAPWIVRGVYHGGREVEALLGNCPAGAACEASQPADHAAYVQMLADAGLNVILESREAMSDGLRAAVAAEPRVGIGHLLFDDPFTAEGHDRLVTSIEAAAADESTLLWFGPDEPDLNHTWPMAAGIARLLRGSSADLDALLATPRYRPASATPFLPADEPAHDPNGLPYGSAVVIDDEGLAVATDLYDFRAPVTYPFQEPYSRADDSLWTIERISRYDEPTSPSTPILQMVELDGLGLIRPSPGQIRAQILGAIVHGAAGAHYFKVAGDDPPFAGRAGWFAADDAEGWAAYTEQHAVWDSLIPVLYSDATAERGTQGILHYRRFALGDRRVLLIVNPTPYHRWVDLDAIVQRTEREWVRRWGDCAPFETRAVEVDAYEAFVLEVVSADVDAPGDPGDPLEGRVPARPPLDPPAPLDGAWTPAADLAAPRSAHAAVVGDEIALLGGYTGALTATNAVAGWPSNASLPDLVTPVASAAAMRAADGTIIVAGGVPRFPTDMVVFPRLHCQRLDGGAWSRCADLGNGPTSNAASLAAFGDLYLFGGLVHIDPMAGDLVTTAVQRYDPRADAWRAETHLPELRVRGATLVHDGVAYLVGGFAQSAPGAPTTLATDALAYDLHTQTWIASEIDPLPTPRANLACVAHRGFGYCVGGYDAAGDNLAVVERVDFATGAWATLEPLPQPLSDTTAVVFDDALHVLGGLTGSFEDSAAVYVMR